MMIYNSGKRHRGSRGFPCARIVHVDFSTLIFKITRSEFDIRGGLGVLRAITK
jgi:hypothetical protein